MLGSFLLLAEQLKGRKVCVGSWFDVMVNYGRKGRAVGAWGRWSHCVRSCKQRRWTLVLSSRSAFMPSRAQTVEWRHPELGSSDLSELSLDDPSQACLGANLI